MADRWLIAGYAGLVGFFALEASVRAAGEASSLDAAPEDRNTTRMIALTYVAAGGSVPLVRRLPGARLPRAGAIAGLGLEISGLFLRAWSMRTLRDSYSRTLRIAEGQHVVDDGPYRVVRHPGYLGSMAIWTGFALTSRRGLPAAIMAVVLGLAYHRRIEVEETLLASQLPGYAAYRVRTWRMVPGIW